MTNATTYIEVAIDAPVTGTFTYGVPESLAGNVRPGLRVLAPFGPREVTGYILGSAEKPTGFRIRNIRDILDDHPLLPPGHLPFYKRMADYYRHPLGESLSSALPSGINLSDRTVFALTETGNAQLATGSKDADILEQLIKGPLPADRIRNADGSVPRGRLDRLVRDHLIEKQKMFQRQDARAKTETIYDLAAPKPKETALSPKRQEVVAYLTRNGATQSQILRKEVPNAGPALKWLLEHNLVAAEEKRIFRDPLGAPVLPDTPPELTHEQKRAVTAVTTVMDQGFCRFLLFGVTGSGKTEVYLRLVAESLARNRPAIVLVPEIALISQTAHRFRARFGEKVAVLHSGLSKGERLDQWETILAGERPVVIGARSAVFAPLQNPGIIIVDEEHDGSYKQDTGLKYNGRDMAVMRAQMEDAVVVLGSATPSVQSWQNVRNGRFSLLTMKERPNRQTLPEVTVVDLKDLKMESGIDRFISRPLFSAMRNALAKGDQALLFLNRRGYAGFPVCSICGEPVKCRHCDITLTLHRQANTFRCHFCGFAMAATNICPHCAAPEVQVLGMGTEKVEAAARYLFPEARILRMDQDTTSRKGTLVKMLRQLRNREVDILVGTQMVAKGHDFPGITVVGILNADMGLGFPDFRSGERTFQTLAQVAGRAGRGERPGRVILQTYNPDHYAIQAACAQHYERFFTEEIGFRKALAYPPFSRMIQVRFSGKREEAVQEAAGLAGQKARAAAKGRIRILGPAQAPIGKLANQYRFHMLLMGTDGAALKTGADAAAAIDAPGVKIQLDVDPYAML